MRTVIAIAVLSGLALAGCGQRRDAAPDDRNASRPVERSSAVPAPVPRPDTGRSGQESFERAFRQSYRASGIAGCVSSAQARAAQGGGAPPGTDFRPACTCYIDRAMAGRSVEELSGLQPGPREEAILDQCAREAGLR